MQVINNILGSELEIGTELTEAQMELLCGGDAAEAVDEDNEDVDEVAEVDGGSASSESDESQYESCYSEG